MNPPVVTPAVAKEPDLPRNLKDASAEPPPNISLDLDLRGAPDLNDLFDPTYFDSLNLQWSRTVPLPPRSSGANNWTALRLAKRKEASGCGNTKLLIKLLILVEDDARGKGRPRAEALPISFFVFSFVLRC